MIKVRLAKSGEGEEILRIYQSGGDFLPYTEVKEVNKAIKENGAGKVSLIVVEVEGKLAGALKLHRPQSHIGKGGKVAVLPEFRGKGIGKIMYKSAIKIFEMEGRRKVTDSLVGDNPAIMAMFEKLGFEIEATMRKHTPAGKTLYQFAYQIDEKGVPELEDVKFDIPFKDYMKKLKENNKTGNGNDKTESY